MLHARSNCRRGRSRSIASVRRYGPTTRSASATTTSSATTDGHRDRDQLALPPRPRLLLAEHRVERARQRRPRRAKRPTARPPRRVPRTPRPRLRCSASTRVGDHVAHAGRHRLGRHREALAHGVVGDHEQRDADARRPASETARSRRSRPASHQRPGRCRRGSRWRTSWRNAWPAYGPELQRPCLAQHKRNHEAASCRSNCRPVDVYASAMRSFCLSLVILAACGGDNSKTTRRQRVARRAGRPREVTRCAPDATPDAPPDATPADGIADALAAADGTG